LGCKKLSSDQAEQIVQGLLQQFEREEYDRELKAWVNRRGQKQQQSEPALWMAAALAQGYRHRNLPQDIRSRILDRLKETQEGLKVYRLNEADRGAWNMFPNQHAPSQHSPFSTAIALLALLEHHRSDLPWEESNATRDALIERTASWLQSQCLRDGQVTDWEPHLWPEGRNPPCDGFTFCCAMLLLKAETLKLGFQMNVKIRAFALQKAEKLATFNGLNVRTQAVIRLQPRKDGEPAFGDVTISIFWYPWALSCCQTIVDAEANDPFSRLQFQKVIQRLIHEEGTAVVRQAQRTTSFELAEFLYAISTVSDRE
jgi:hypothetical protein